MPKITKLILISPSLSPGGAERVISILANELVKQNVEVTLILLTKQERFYKISDAVEIIEPDIKVREVGKLKYQWKSFWWLRNQFKTKISGSILSFGGKYNSFVLLASLGLNRNVFISDRSRPGISYGKFIDVLNRFTYRYATGIIAQTQIAKEYSIKKYKNNNVRVIGNPIDEVQNIIPPENREKIILNVGRFIPSKHQEELIRTFTKLNEPEWKLIFLGEGPTLENCKEMVAKINRNDTVLFKGTVKNVKDYLKRASVFAFTSSSEGFPNALAEAMSFGCASISYDCVAGPRDLIEDGLNGFIIPMGKEDLYLIKLIELVNNLSLRENFGQASIEKTKLFNSNKICNLYFQFILENSME